MYHVHKVDSHMLCRDGNSSMRTEGTAGKLFESSRLNGISKEGGDNAVDVRKQIRASNFRLLVKTDPLWEPLL